MLKKLTVLLLGAALLAGCIGESIDDCPQCRLTLRYTYNYENVDRITAHIQDIHIYVFDTATRLLVDVIEVGPTDIERGWVDVSDLPDGRYTFVAWGGSGDDMSRSFLEAHMHDATEHDHSDSRIGTTTLDDFYMMLDYDELPADVHGDIAPKSDDFDDLFHAMVENVSLKRGETRSVDFDFIRNTNVLKVTVTGLEHLWNHNYNGGTRAPSADQPLHVFAVGKNGRYQWNNTIDTDARLVRYEPPCHTLTANTMEVDIKTMRLDVDRHTNDPVELHIRNAVTGHEMIEPLDVVGAITRTRSTRGDLLWPDQEAIDREYEFPLEISILHDLSVMIKIGNWTVVEPKPDVDRP